MRVQPRNGSARALQLVCDERLGGRLALGGGALARVLLGGLQGPAVAQLALAVELGHRGLLLGVRAHAAPSRGMCTTRRGGCNEATTAETRALLRPSGRSTRGSSLVPRRRQGCAGARGRPDGIAIRAVP